MARLNNLASTFAGVLGCADNAEGSRVNWHDTTDQVLRDLQVANLSRAIAEGDLASSWQLGVVVANFITERKA